MKKIYILLLTASTLTFAQKNTSFETKEGYELGNINTQNNWEVAEGNGKVLDNQIISDEQASEGSYSFKNGDQIDFGPKYFPVMGVTKTFEKPVDYKGFTISFDAFVTKRDGADFEFTLFTINPETDEFNPVAGLGMENRGYLYIAKDIEYGFDYADAAEGWPINKWNNFKIEVTENEIKYYLNDKLVYTGDNFTKLDVHGFTMLHNNYGGDAYYDNFKFSTDSLAVNQIGLKEFKMYPNPVQDVLTFDTNFYDQISGVEVSNTVGQIVLKTDKSLKELNMSSLKSGIYFVKIYMKDGKTMTRKTIKK
ncbi:T9SS type A sorting domain-containing protein [Empedobacter falsenii]|uniref:T9SS type A sorting domain-containing protein n=1 Tax=Empedobacter falsenii TaxID=343874 RepID=UPI003A7F751E